ncbi:MAG: VOC family protein [Luminiphilus sp.]|nr:VOC family protein [Luminiphilus sp.]
MPTSIDHIIITVPDLASATADYSQLLGRSPSWRGAHPDYGTANTLFKLENTYIELLAVQGEGMAADIVTANLESRGSSLGGIVVGTDNATDFINHARDKGLAASDPIPGHGVDEITGAARHWHNIFWDPAAARGVFSFCIEHDPDSSLPEATPTGEDPITAVDHIVVRTQSADAAKKFYGDQLGIRLALEQHVPDWGGTQLFFRASSMSIEVIASEKAPEEDDLWGLAFKTASLDTTHQRLINKGIDVSEIREGRKPGTRVCTIKSHTLEVPTLLIEHPTN